ncbi:lycopene cyclase domain-containing protein [Echinicola strongylocentroti]|uniref:Lycopene cyclase domain-containing protein n=1 Tax=Echinicola strongylocentroti TaxID=1795355 RepID=A0A2Z4IHA8_9BACT|nr:lycopene cyclase domain-containing protein [Echinicola strongylocentroti]AWW30531.1 lycopene cyclase domain-containing protein [Echinicola strongylocentroti]
MERYLYLAINIATVLFPVLWSFERKVCYYKKWPFLFPSMAITAVVFLVWDHWFTDMSVWGFNDRYLSGIYLGNLPLEEYLFFITVPFSCIFIYEVLQYYLDDDTGVPYAKPITFLLMVFLFGLSAMNWQKWYTAVNFAFVAGLLAVHYIVFRSAILGRFYLFYLVHLIPFLVVNGALTGAFTPEPVVMYNNMENLSIRIFTIPIEDFVYSMGLMLMNVSLYQFFRQRKTISASVG